MQQLSARQSRAVESEEGCHATALSFLRLELRPWLCLDGRAHHTACFPDLHMLHVNDTLCPPELTVRLSHIGLIDLDCGSLTQLAWPRPQDQVGQMIMQCMHPHSLQGFCQLTVFMTHDCTACCRAFCLGQGQLPRVGVCQRCLEGRLAKG